MTVLDTMVLQFVDISRQSCNRGYQRNDPSTSRTRIAAILETQAFIGTKKQLFEDQHVHMSALNHSVPHK